MEDKTSSYQCYFFEVENKKTIFEHGNLIQSITVLTDIGQKIMKTLLLIELNKFDS